MVGRVADKVAMHHDHIVSVPSCTQIQRADAGVELLFNEIFLAGHFVVAGVPAALHVGGGGIVGAGDVERGEIAVIRQQTHPVGVFIRFAHVVCRVPVQHLDPPAEGEFALLQIAALLRPGSFSRPAVLFGILEVVPRHDVEIGISVFQEKGLGIAVPVLLQIEPLRERPFFEIPDVYVAAGLCVAAFDVPVAPVAGLTEALVLDAEAARAVRPSYFMSLNVELIADAVFPCLDVIAVGSAAVLRCQFPLGGGDGHALDFHLETGLGGIQEGLPLFSGGDHEVISLLQIIGRFAGGSLDGLIDGGRRDRGSQAWQQRDCTEQQTDDPFFHRVPPILVVFIRWRFIPPRPSGPGGTPRQSPA